MQIYRGMDIGTSKPIDHLPHHLLDIRDPREQFNVADFVRLAEDAVADILARGGIPVVSGGSAFYFKHLWFGLPEGPPDNPEIRRCLETRCASEGLEVLRAELERVDPQSNRRIQRNDAYRVIRALEVYQTGGRPLSSYHLPDTPRADFPVLAFGLQRSRAKLYERINRRVELMFEAGLVDELRRLIRQGCTAQDPAMRAIGYREFFQADVLPLLHSKEALPEELQRTLIARIQRATRHYAKRQLTFFAKLPNVQWLAPESFPEHLPAIQRFFSR